MIGWLARRRGADLDGVVGNVVVGDVTGTLTQIFVQGGAPDVPALPWRELPSDPDVFRLLSWRTRLAPLVGRERELASLLAWAGEGAGPRVRFLTGSGGAGKTRLAAEAAQSLRDRGWTAGFTALEQPAIFPVTSQGLLLVVDYPEERRPQTRALLAGLAGLEARSSPVRVLLLSRRDLDWWQEEIDAAHAADVCDGQSLALSSLDAAGAFLLYQAVVSRAGQHFARATPEISADVLAGWLARRPEVHGLPLFVLTAALEAALGGRGLAAGDEVVPALVRRERLRIDNIGRAEGLGPRGGTRLLGLATAAGGLGRDAVRRLSAPGLELGLPAAEAILDTLLRFPYWEHDRLPALAPDLVAAALLMDVLADREDLAPEWLWAALAGAPSGWVDRIERVARDAAVVHGAADHRLGGWLAAMLDRDATRAAALEAVVRQLQPSATLPLALRVGQRLLSAAASDDGERAVLLVNVSNLVAAAGDRGQAAGLVGEAVTILERLAAVDPAFEPQLAGALNNLSNRLSEAGDRTGAFAAIRRSLAITSRLTVARAPEDRLELANGLNNLSAHAFELGLADEAIDASRTAIAQYRELLAGGRAEAARHLATSLVNLSQLLEHWRDGYPDDRRQAIEAVREAVALLEPLADADPRLTPELVRALHTLSNRLARESPDEAWQTARRARQLAQQLAAAEPIRFTATLAVSHETLASRLAERGDREAAVEAIRASNALLRDLAAASPGAFEDDFARSLTHLMDHLRAGGREPEAIEAGREALPVLERLASRHPMRWGAAFVQLLNNLAILYRRSGGTGHAVYLATEAVTRARTLAGTAPHRFDGLLANTLATLQRSLVEAGQFGDAFTAIEESAAVFRRLAQRDPDTYEEPLLSALMQAVQTLMLTGASQEELTRHPLFLESVELGKRFAAASRRSRD